jgi:hypothetical protein
MSGESDLDSRPGASARAGALVRLGLVRQRPEVVAGEAAAAAAQVELASPVPDPTAAAFFDVDNTLMRGASIYYFARGLAARKMFGPRAK